MDMAWHEGGAHQKMPELLTVVAEWTHEAVGRLLQ